LAWASTQKPQPLIWLARSSTSSSVVLGTVADRMIAMLVPLNRLPISAPSSLPFRSKRGSMISSSLVVAEPNDHETAMRRPL
jgi:hypothetical protein